MIKTIVKDMKLDDKIYKPSTILGRISMAKNNLIVAQSYAQSSRILSEDTASKRPLLGEIYKQYQQRCKQSDTMDFDDLLLQTNDLFRDFPDILTKYNRNSIIPGRRISGYQLRPIPDRKKTFGPAS